METEILTQEVSGETSDFASNAISWTVAVVVISGATWAGACAGVAGVEAFKLWRENRKAKKAETTEK